MSELSQQEIEDIREIFIDKMFSIAKEFQTDLTNSGLSKATVNKYYSVVWAFIDYIGHYTDHLSYESISVGNANSKFITKAKHETLYDWDSKEIKSKLTRFIEFLDKKGYHNPKVLVSLKKK